MTGIEIAFLVIAIASAIMSTGVSVNNMTTASRNQKLRAYIQKTVNILSDQISKGRLSFSKLINLLQSKSSNALMTYLQNNPVIARNIAGIQSDSEFIAEIQAEQSALESEWAGLESQLAQYGYNQDWTSKSSEEEKRKVEHIKQQMDDVKGRYDALVEKAKGYSISTTEPVRIETSDIDARSQNINGGVKND